MRVADYIFERLNNVGVDTIFSVSGRGALYLTDAVAKNSKIKNIASHHEQASGFAAVGYAQASESLGVALVSTGCASTNLITPVLSAWQDNLPCIFISGQNILGETSNYTGLKIRTYGQQEADIIPIVSSITKFSRMIHKAEEIVDVLEHALTMALSGRKGPCWIDVPLCLQSAQIDISEDDLNKPIVIKANPKANDIEIEEVAELIKASKRPSILIGSGIKSAKAQGELSDLIKLTSMPVIYAHSACDVYNYENHMSIGSIGAMGASRAGNFTLQNCDLLIVIGHRLSSYTTGVDFHKFCREGKIIVVDIDPIEHQKKSVGIDQLIISDALSFIKTLRIKLDGYSASYFWREKCLQWKRVFPAVEENFKNSEEIDLYELTEVLSEHTPPNYCIATDSGFIELILPSNFKFKNGQKAIHPIAQGAMGYSLPAAIGAYFSTKNPVVVVVGDGSIMMNIQELQTIKHHKLPIAIIVVNNDVYGIIRRRQKDLFRRRLIGVDPDTGVSCPNYEKIAIAFELNYVRIQNKIELSKQLSRINNLSGPIIIEVFTKSNQDYIEVSNAKNENGKWVRRPLEDQFPFLDRSLFLQQMIVQPIDQ